MMPVWIVPEARYQDLDKIIFPWVQMWEAGFGAKFPPMEYRSENGSYLGSIGVSQGVKHRSGPATTKRVQFAEI